MPERTFDVEIAVVGGGLAGLSLSAALAGAGVAVACLDRETPEGRPDIRTTAVALASQRVLRGAGVWAHVGDRAGPIREIRVADQASPLFLHFDHRQLDEGAEPLGWIVDNRDLRDALNRRAAELPALTHLTSAEVLRFEREPGAVRIHLADGRAVRARLLGGADGRSSPVRDWVGIPTRRWSYPQTAIVCTLGLSRPHGGVALEHFLPGGPFAVLPMSEDRVSIVWSERPALAARYRALPEPEFLAELLSRSGDWIGQPRLLTERVLWPLSVQLADRLIDDRVALVSEAAHAIHPVAGQGLNLGLRDVAALAQVVIEARRLGQDLGGAPVLERYQRWRRFDTLAMAAVCDGLVRLFSNDSDVLGLGRRLGLAAVNRTGFLKRHFMGQAMGLVGQLPALARGEPL
jgi:2-octaprenyl-6-methoxyphenol hydroxylase